MAKRFTDTNKWDAVWIRELSAVNKAFLFYLWDKCNAAGIWKVDWKTAEHYINARTARKNPFPPQDFPVVELEGGRKWFMPSFIPFQYPGGLNPMNRAHTGILRELERHNISYLDYYDEHGELKPLGSPLLGASIGAKEQEKDKDKDKDKEEDSKRQHITPAVLPGLPLEVLKLWQQLQSHCPSVFKMSSPLTATELERIARRYPRWAILSVFTAMENKPDLVKKYKSANLTFQNWVQREKIGPNDKPFIQQHVQPEQPKKLTDDERGRIMMENMEVAYKTWEENPDGWLAPAVYDYMVKAGWVVTQGDSIMYKPPGDKEGRIIKIASRKGLLDEAKEEIDQAIQAAVEKKVLTPRQIITKLADLNSVAKSKTVAVLFKEFSRLGKPWQNE